MGKPGVALRRGAISALEAKSEWEKEAACRNENPQVFFPGVGESDTDAQRYCRACPVIDQCRDYGIMHELHGVWGGLSARARRRIRKERGISVTSPGYIPSRASEKRKIKAG